MIDRATVDRILDAVRIEEVIGDFVSLRKRGSNYLGLCPFHQDKNPSMSVSATKGIFKCFSCGKAGSAVSFIMDHEHLTYPEALRYLAKKYNIEIVEKEESAEEIADRMKYESLLVVSEYAQKYYQDILWNTDIGRAIGLSYFRERKFTDETIRKFGLGYAASRGNELHKDAILKGYKKEYLLQCGLCVERDNGDLADRFFDRVMFPIYSLSGKVIAFGGRTLKSDKTVAKYVNSPETEIYVKSRSLYGLFQAKNAIMKQDKAILVEGYADVISMHQAGVENVVASSGTSLTVEQIRLIKRFTNNVTIIYDGDEAGIKASLRGIDLVLEEGLSVKIVPLPVEDDPDSFAKAHSKVEILEYIEENERDFIDYKSDILSKDMASDPLRKSQLIGDIIKSVSVIPDQILRRIYVDSIAEKFGQKQEDILQRISELRRKKKAFDRQYRNRTQPWQSDSAPQGLQEPQAEPVAGEGPAQGPLLADSYLAVPEKELVRYLIRFGSYMMHFEENMVVGAPQVEDMTVEQYIKGSLDDDELVFVNDIYRRMYEEYFNFVAGRQREEDPAKIQEAVIKHFITHEDIGLMNEALGMVVEDHPLTVQKYRNELAPEELMLAVTVPKAVVLYKLRITEEQSRALEKAVAEAQHGGDLEEVKKLVEKLQLINRVKTKFAKELMRL